MGHFPKLEVFMSVSQVLLASSAREHSSSTCVCKYSLIQYLSHQCFYFLAKKNIYYISFMHPIFFTSGIKWRANTVPVGDLPLWPSQHHCHFLSVHQPCTLAACSIILTYNLFTVSFIWQSVKSIFTFFQCFHIHTFWIIPVYSSSDNSVCNSY